MRGKVDEYELAAKNVDEGLDELGESAAKFYSGDVTPAIRSDIDRARKTSVSKEKAAWKHADEMLEIGPNGRARVLLDNGANATGGATTTPITQAARDISQQSQLALSRSLENSQVKLLEDMGFHEEAVKMRQRGLARSTPEEHLESTGTSQFTHT